MIEIVFYTINKYIGHMIYQASDAGHCMYVHLFGALFGLFASRMNLKTFHRTHPQQARTYQSDIWTIIGTLFLWICFPSFNAAFSTEMLRQRALINTLFALLASTLSTFIFTVFVSTDGKFGVTHAQNAVLAGGVAISATASTICHPWVSLVIGVVAGMLAVFSIEYKQKCILDKAGFHDTRFVLSLHAVPAFFGAIMSMVVSGMATENSIGKLNLYQAYPAMTPDDSTNDTLIHSWVRMGKVNFSDGRSGGDQARYQMYTLLTTMLISIIGGAITGLLLSFKWCDMPTAENAFDDGDQWAVAEEGMASFEAYIPVPHAVEMVERSVVAEDTVELKKNEMTNEEEIEEVKKDGNGTTPIESDH
uniref:Ammonium transporter AmtB-like domain-containing protein n=1 Tax=Plectus sambesii TaxID=2011161 RepID=A0A914XCP6_9BILA